MTVHIRCFLHQHVCGSFVDLLHSLFAEWRRMIVTYPVPNDSQEISDFEEVVPDIVDFELNASQGTGTESTSFSAMEWRADRRRAKAPLSDRSWDKEWAFTTRTEGKARSQSGSKPHGENRAPEGKWRPETSVLGGVRASPSTAVAGGQGSRSKSRRCHRSGGRRRERSSSVESDAGSDRSGARARGGSFRESGLHGCRRPGARGVRRSDPWYGEGSEGVRGPPLYASGARKVWRDGSGSALREVDSFARRSRSRSRRGISGGEQKNLQRFKARDCRGWAAPFRTNGRRRAGGPSGGSGGANWA